MKRTAKIVAIVLAVLLAGSVVASAAGANIASQARGEAEAKADADVGIEAVLQFLGFVKTQADAAAESAEEAEGEAESEANASQELFSDVDIQAQADAEAEAEKRVQAETPKAPPFPPQADIYGQADQVFEMTAMADQRVVMTWDAGVVATARDATSADISGPGFSGSLDLVGDAVGEASSSGEIVADTHQLVVIMEEGETLIMSTESDYDKAYRLGADTYNEIRDEAHVEVDETVRAYAHLQAEAEAEGWSKAKWAVEQTEFHENVAAELTGEATSTADLVLHSTSGGEASGSAENQAQAAAEGASEAAGSAEGHPPVCEV